MHKEWSPFVSYDFILEESQKRKDRFVHRGSHCYPVMSYIDFIPATKILAHIQDNSNFLSTCKQPTMSQYNMERVK